MPSLHLHLFANGFAIGDLRRTHLNFHTEFGFQFGRDHIQMLLTQTGQNLLVRFGIGAIADGGILLHHTLQTGSNFFLVALVFGDHRHRQTGLFKINTGQHHRTRRGAQGVTGVGVVQLCHRTDVTRADIRRFLLLFAADIKHLADLFLLAGAHIQQLGVGRHFSADHLEVQQLAHERVHHAFEHDRRGLGVFVDRQRHFVAVGVHAVFTGDGFRPRR